MASPKSPHEYTIGGVKVYFPVKAYPSQVAMMSKIINALQKGQNSLLESPTGSGKSLALLCAALAWQRQERQRVEEYNRAIESGLMEPETVMVDPLQEQDTMLDGDEYFDTGAGFFQASDPDTIVLDENGDVVPPPPSCPAAPPAAAGPGGMVERKIKKKKVPKIYFGTRTHRQITQIIRELKKTTYRGARMSILGSRDHTCIHPTVSKMKNRNEGCRELTDRRAVAANGYPAGGGCVYQGNVKQKLASHHSLSAYRGTDEAWDLEDLVKVGKKVRACPYYATRELKNRSDIVFCPYNYLVEPLIRKSMEIYLKGNVVILDEAHNIEDSARSAASWEVTQEQLQEAMQDFEQVLEAKAAGDPEAYKTMVQACSKFSKWMGSHSDRLNDYQDYNSQSKVWNGTEIVAEFNYWELGPANYTELRKCYQIVVDETQAEAFDDQEEDGGGGKNWQQKMKPRVSAATLSMLEGFFTVTNYLYMNDMKHRDDYRVALIKTQSRKGGASGGGPGKRSGLFSGWISKSETATGSASSMLGNTLKVNFWCLNPAVCFGDLKDDVRSIVLTSGTLSPMASFSSELDVKFPVQLEANHVVNKQQVWIGTLSHGPTGHNLNATYRNTESFSFQDEIGRLTLSVCQNMSRGILLFLPSYKMLTKLSERWQSTGIWDQIGRKKVIVVEPRFSDEFESAMRHFYEVIETTKDAATTSGADNDCVDGALFMAVCRGKVSEGLDFADDNARAVICLGIPFPNIKDVQVDLKKKYNDKRRVENKDILTGNEWYEIQAFRALNQALGRCIRHRDDWGAIIMVDDRYARIGRYINSLSKWVRSGVVHYSDCNMMTSRLAEFSEQMRQFDADRVKIQEEEEELLHQRKQQEQLETSLESNKNEESTPSVGGAAEGTNASVHFSGNKSQGSWISKGGEDSPVTSSAGKLKALKNKLGAFAAASPSRSPEGYITSSVKNSSSEPNAAGEPSEKRRVESESGSPPSNDQENEGGATSTQQVKKKFKFSPVTSSEKLNAKPKPVNAINAPRQKAKAKISAKNPIQYESDDDDFQ